jgi:predicted transcriptional regulator
MLVRAIMAENDVMQELVLSKLEELGLKKNDELKYAEKLIDSKSDDNAIKKLAQTAENGVKKAAGLASIGTRNVLKSLVWQLQRSIELP